MDVALFSIERFAFVLVDNCWSCTPSPLLSFPFSHLLLLMLYNPWYAGAYLYWRRFASSINIVGGDPPPPEIIRKKTFVLFVICQYYFIMSSSLKNMIVLPKTGRRRVA